MNLQDKKIWFIADFHFGHHKVIEYCNRPFKTTTEMNNALIKNYNSVVGGNDIVYILGDLSFLNTESTTQIVNTLKGFKILIKGNHDPKTNSGYRKMGFIEVYDKPIILFDKYILSHEPIETNYGDMINIYGHLHNNVKNDDLNKFCVSVEKIDYKPISLNEIYSKLNQTAVEYFPFWRP